MCESRPMCGGSHGQSATHARDEAEKDGLASVSSASSIWRSEGSFLTLHCVVIVDEEDWLSSLDFLLVVVGDSLSDESSITSGRVSLPS